ncbi:hypothetical protein [Williamsia soli]|uniref:hypothetical protein n=1 Tax=Williamsia soli TaxID=364929 RepID=UPI001AA00172|nr:hypothetical protein [Williamsia soli]
MKHVVTGIADDGSSFLESVTVHDGPIVESGSVGVYEHSSVPDLTRPASGILLDLAPEPGTVTWRLIEFWPGRDIPFHHTDSVDISVVVDGTVDFAVDSETIGLDVGDVVVVNGAGHSWKTEVGCRLLVGMVGGRTAAE